MSDRNALACEFHRSAYSHFKVHLSRLGAACAATEGRLPEAPADVERAVGQLSEVDTRTACDGAHKHTCNDATQAHPCVNCVCGTHQRRMPASALSTHSKCRS
jgi:hypothetical protein